MNVLYLGDTALDRAASYLAGVMKHYGISFDYHASDEKFNDELFDNNYQAVIISDYPAENFSQSQLERLSRQISNGMGLVMIGGWESFTGANGEYTNTILRDVLPVLMKEGDDRINCPQPCLVEKNCEHEIITSLPFDDNPPCIGGFNLLKAKPTAATILSARKFTVLRSPASYDFSPEPTSYPLLVTGQYGKGRVACFASDVAPHWVGGLVDWGDERVHAQADGAEAVEVGNLYARLFSQIVKWTFNGTA